MKYGIEAKKYLVVVDPYKKGIQAVSFVAFALACYHACFLPQKLWAPIIGLALLTTLYILPLLPNNGRLRNWGGLKIFVVAIVWAGATVLLPVLGHDGKIAWWDTMIETVRRFLMVLILIVPFEIRDLKYDAPDLNTMPQRYGVARTKTVASFLDIPLFFLILFKDSVLVFEVVVGGILFLTLGFLMYFTRRGQSRYFSSFWVEALPIGLWALYLVAVRF